MSRRPASRPQRRRIFLGCEGESERSYGALLARLIETRHHRTHLETVLLRPGGGDPLALIKLAAAQIGRRSDRRNPFAARFVLLDSDKLGLRPNRDATMSALARDHAIRLVWQEPCHEALLLRHLEGCEASRPMSCARAEAELRRRWPEYQKGLPAVRLEKRIDEQCVFQASRVEAVLAEILEAIEFGRD